MCGRGMTKNKKELVSQIKNFDLVQDIILLGEKDNMENIYNAIDLLICTSLTESFGLVAVEALACGKEVISSDLPALREVVRKENLSEPNNCSIFAKKSINYINNAVDDELSEKKNRNLVYEKYNIDETVKGYYDIYKEII
tara:strand:- start:137 stop:559 length:423 start_codon:yes stop_codon:yes gene_type:complete